MQLALPRADEVLTAVLELILEIGVSQHTARWWHGRHGQAEPLEHFSDLWVVGMQQPKHLAHLHML